MTKKFIVFIAIISFMFALSYSFAFTDVDSSHWAYNSIIEMQKKGLVRGYEDGSFKPEKEVTREEFAQMVYNVDKREADIRNVQYYYDVVGGRWSYAAIQLVGYSIMDSADGYAYFYPTRPILREEVAKVLNDYYGFKVNITVPNISDNTSDYVEYYIYNELELSDKNEISKSYLDAVYNMYTSGLMNGVSNTRFSPKSSLTRAQAATLLLRITKMNVNSPTQEPVATKTPAPTATPVVVTPTPRPVITPEPQLTLYTGEGDAPDILAQEIPSEIRYNDSFTFRFRKLVPERSDVDVIVSNGVNDMYLGPDGVPGSKDEFVLTGKAIAEIFEDKSLRTNPEITITIKASRHFYDEDPKRSADNEISFKSKYIFEDSEINDSSLTIKYNIPTELRENDTFSISFSRYLKEDETIRLSANNSWTTLMFAGSKYQISTVPWVFIDEDINGNELNWHLRKEYTFSAKQVIEAYKFSNSIERCPDVTFSFDHHQTNVSNIRSSGNNVSKFIFSGSSITPAPTTNPQAKDLDLSFLKFEDNGTKNMVYSPLSIKYALKMLDEGAEANTKAEIDALVGNLNLTKYERIDNVLSLANGLFILDTYSSKISNEYKETLMNKYNADLILDKFKNANNINSWVSDKTLGILNNAIPDEFLRVPNLKMVLCNALAIKMDWQTKFIEGSTRAGDFYKTANNIIRVATMDRDLNIRSDKYYVDNSVTAVSMNFKKYDDVQLEFIAIMPNSNLSNYIKNLKQSGLNNVLSKLNKPTKIAHLYIPRFKFEYGLDQFVDDLNKLGIEEAFTGSADFSKMIKSHTPDLYVSNALHKASIDFKESGVDAAAVTAFTISAKSVSFVELPEVIRIDKPFLFIIRDVDTSEVWFVGAVYEPELWK
jgi:serine protease inhibitor